MFERHELDEATLIKAEKEALEQPSHSMFWDNRLFNTHGLTFSWSDRGDSLEEESNYLCAMAQIKKVAGRYKDHVVDASINHWLVGTQRQLFVRTRLTNGQFTAAFREAVAIALNLKEYPLVDKDDFNRREYERFDEQIDRALTEARNEHPYDSETDHLAICDRFNDNGGTDTYPEVNQEHVTDLYRESREAYFKERASDHAR